MKWLQDSSQSNVDDLKNVRREAGRYFRNKKKVYLKTKIDELETDSKVKNTCIRDLYRGISDFSKGYQPRANIVQDLVRGFHSILARWRNHFSQLCNVHVVNDVRQTEIHTAEPLVSEPCALRLRFSWLFKS